VRESSPNWFRRRLAYLARGFTLAPLSQLDRLQARGAGSGIEHLIQRLGTVVGRERGIIKRVKQLA
jgi:hypothetical protein